MPAAKITKRLVTAALSRCYDPELGVDVISLGLVQRIEIRSRQVIVTMTLTSPTCPLWPLIKRDIHDKIAVATGAAEIIINLSFDPPWHPGRIKSRAKRQLSLTPLRHE